MKAKKIRNRIELMKKSHKLKISSAELKQNQLCDGTSANYRRTERERKYIMVNFSLKRGEK